MKKHQGLKSLLSIFILLILTIFVLYFSLKDDFNDIVTTLKSANLFLLAMGFVFVLLYWIFKSIVLYNFTRKFKSDYSFKSAFRIQSLTQFFNAITPFSSGGQPFQIYSLKKSGLTISNATNITIEEFIVYQIALVFLGIVAIIFNHILGIFPYDSLLSRLVLIGFSINTLVIIFLFIIAFGKKANKFLIKIAINILTFLKIVKDKDKKLKEWNSYINNFHSGAKILISNKREFLANIFYSLLGLMCLYIVPLWIMFSLGEFSIFNGLEAIIASAYVMLIGSFVPLPGGTGGVEYGFVKFFGVFILSSVTLNAVMLLWRFVTFYMGIIVGSICLNIKERK